MPPSDHLDDADLAVDTNAAQVLDVLARKGTHQTPITIDANATVTKAVALLKTHRIGALIVTGPDSGVVGILSERDIVRKLADTPGATLPQSVEENMTRDVITCTPQDVLLIVLKHMSEGRFRHMPVMENGALAGVISIGDVVKARLSELSMEKDALEGMIKGF